MSTTDRPGLTLAEYEGLVHWVVRRQWLGGLSYAEALHAGRIALWQAWQRFDPGRGNAFSTYAVPAIRRAVWRAVAGTRARPWELLVSSPPQPEATDPAEALEAALIRQAIHHLVASLPAPLGYVIVAHYGLGGDPPCTFAAIGRVLGVTRQRAQQLHVEALLWLAHPAHSLALRELLQRNTVSDYRAYLTRLRIWLRTRRKQWTRT